MNEQRQFTRINLDSRVYVSEFSIPRSSDELVADVVNISAGGLLFKTKSYFEVGALLKLKIQVGGWDKYLPIYKRFNQADYAEPLITLASVVRVDNQYDEFLIAVRYDAIDTSHQESLNKFIQSNA